MRIAIDTGGTFTDCVFVRNGELCVVKLLSTPQNPAQAIADALARISGRGGEARRTRIEKRNEKSEKREENIHSGSGRPLFAFRSSLFEEPLDLTCGTTVGTNALLERRGGRVALVTTAGFEDVLEIGRQARPRLYDFFVERPEPLVPRERRIGLRERIGASGEVLLAPSRAELARAARRVRKSGAHAVAVCLLFSYANPAHERAVARALEPLGVDICLSHEILPEFREFERTATTVVNAYLVPVMSRYLAEIETHANRASRGARVRIMQSSGGVVSASVAAREPVRTILSGPAGGVLGASYVAARSGFARIISFDMGGTSTDVALVEGALRTSNEASVAELPVAVPMLDIHTVGAGGGSIARFDRAGALRVGPKSAGADPGPICYGRGEQPTVTDAHLVLGRIPSEGLLGGEFRLDEARAHKWMERALRDARTRMRSEEEFAEGILAVANATMEKAIRVISIERGYDPRDYTLVAFGGAGGLHGCELAAALKMPAVLVPKIPGALSALGILRADVVKDFSLTVRLPVTSQGEARREVRRAFSRIEAQGQRDLRHEGFRRGVRIERLLDVRYIGQAYELTVPAAGDFVGAFHALHERRYGYADASRRVEVVNIRARFSGATPKPELPRGRMAGANARAAIVGTRKMCIGGRWRPAALYDRARLRPGNHLLGPAIVAEYSATTFVPPAWRLRVDAYENLLLEQR